MQKFLYFVLILLLVTPLCGQMDVKQGEWNTALNKGTHQGFVMADSAFVYTIDYVNNTFRNEQKLIANVYDKKTLDFLSSFDIDPNKKEGVELDLVELFSVQQSMVLVMVENNKSNPTEKRILLQLIHPNGERENPIVAETLPSQQNVNEDFQVIVDKNETGFIICTNYPVALEENQKLKITAFNADLSQKWSKTLEFPDKDKQYIFTDWRYDGDSKVFFLSRHIIDMYQVDMEFTSLTQNTYFLWGYDFSIDKLKEIELSLNQRFIHKISIEYDQNRWLVAGIFANDKNFRTDGIFNLILDSNWRVNSHIIHNLTIEENRIFENKLSSKNDKKGIDEIQVKGIETFENGDFVLIGEDFYKEIEEPNDGRMSNSNFTEVFHYRNISLFWFESNGAIKGMYSIPKNQISVNDRGAYSSFTMAKDKNSLFFFYNDHPKNSPTKNPNDFHPKPISGFRKVYLKGIKMDEKGITRKKIVFSTSRKAHIRPIASAQLLDGTVYFLAQKRKKNALLSVQFP